MPETFANGVIGVTDNKCDQTPEKNDCCGDSQPCCDSKPTVTNCCESAPAATSCCGGETKPASSCCESQAPASGCCGSEQASSGCWGSAAEENPLLGRFNNMIGNCLDYAIHAKNQGRPLVGMMCEYTPRELIIAAGGVPICMCGGSQDMIGPAEQVLPANLCPLIKSTFGYHMQKANPFMEIADLLVAETTCDGKKKMYEILSKSRPMYVLELTQKSGDPEAFDHWVAELRKFKEELERKFNCVITDEKLRDAIRLMNRERSLRLQIAEYMKQDNPPISGRELIEFKSIISGIDEDLEQYEKSLCELDKTEKQRCSKPVRVLLTGVPMAHGAERVLDIIENKGGLVVAQETCTGVKPILQNIDENAPDPLVAIARKYYELPCSVMTDNNARLDSLRELVEQYKPDCVIDLVWQTCLTYDIESHLVENFVTEELGLGYLKIETDYSSSDSARIELRVEAMLESVASKA